MSETQIVGKEYYCKDIFDKTFRFFIPRYQRPYAWTKEETEELLTDLWSAFTADDSAVEKKDPYFLGSIVLVKNEHHPRADIIDGQQRAVVNRCVKEVRRRPFVLPVHRCCTSFHALLFLPARAH